MLKIPITIGGKEVFITSDAQNFMLATLGVNKKGDEVLYAEPPYCSTLEALFECLFEMKIRRSDATTLHELQKDIFEAKRELTGLYRTPVFEREVDDGEEL